MESVLHPVADKYHIYFGTNRGYSSATTMYDIAKRVKEKILEGKQAVVLYLGDHDPSGLDMVRDIRERINEFLTQGDEPVLPDFEVVQVALNIEQVRKHKLPPNPAKITDPRAKKYIEEFGNISWELDALKPEILIGLTEKEILVYLEKDKYRKWMLLEEAQKKKLEAFGKALAKADTGDKK